ncbi:MAG TPA: hypothetical protein VK586_18520, partial [Streptosporangiaceae bacterium]|nr:hypothetical protein [Streptosporangiaceae bacterium]
EDGAESAGSAEPIVSPSAVVDGLAVAQADPADVAHAVLPTGSAASPSLAAALAGGIDLIQSHQDALADLLTAESVHQVLAGNSARAGAALDAAARGGMPPDDYEVLRTPRSGAALTCRVAVLLPAAGGTLPGRWPVSLRGSADPSCAAWLAAVLPPLARVRVRIANAAGAITDVPIPPAALLGPLDIVLDLPEAVHARIQLALPAGQTVVAARDPAWTPSTVGLDELLTVAADLREVLRGRPLRSADLSTPSSAPTGTPATGAAATGAAATGTSPADGAVPEERDAADLTARLTAARASLQHASATVHAAIGPLTTVVAAVEAGQAGPAGLAAAVAAARAAIGTAMAHGVPLRPDADALPTGLLAVLTAAAAELTRRLAIPVPGAGAGVDDLVAALRDVFGAGQPAVPRLVIDAATAAAAVPGLAAGDRFLAEAPDLAADWLDDSAAVRTNTGLLVNALQGCDALSAGAGLAGGWRILDPPASTSGNKPGTLPGWTATLAAADLAGIAPAETLVVHAAGPFSPVAGSTLAGLLVDTWVEVVPQPEAATSVAYQADAPTARAPQAILLGLAPDIAKGWNADLVADLALEALSLAGLRTVDAETAAWLGRMLPAVVLPDGDAADVIDAPARPLLQVDPALLAAARVSSKELG